MPLFTQETTSADMIRLEASDPVVQVWWGTRVEVKAALFRKVLTGHLNRVRADLAADRMDARFSGLYVPNDPTFSIRNRAETLLERHDLRAADAL